MTMVSAASTELEESVCMKSLDTKGCSSKLMMPFIGPSAAALMAAFTSSLEVFLLTLRTRSTTETLGVGTRKAMPLNLPLNCGSTCAGRHNVASTGTRTAQVTVAAIEDHLITSV